MNRFILLAAGCCLVMAADVHTAGAAELRIVAPADGAVVPLLTRSQKAYYDLPRSERVAAVTNAAARAKLSDVGTDPNPVHLSWRIRSDSGFNPRFSVRVFRRRDRHLSAFVQTVENSVDVPNLEIATEYDWTVSALEGDVPVASADGHFVTEDRAPRFLKVPGVKSFRDLGGRRGLGGRRVRQNLIFRSKGLNSNATQPDKEHPDRKREPGKCWLTSETKDLLVNQFGIRTDLDLRRDDETWGMTGSPVGDRVRWVHVSAHAYDGMPTKAGKAAFAQHFRLFLDKANYPIDFHCIAGADRTGSLAYILGGLLGVDEDELWKDWETNVFIDANPDFRHRNRMEFLSAYFNSLPGETLAEKMEHYVVSCGFTRDDVRRFREIMLEGGLELRPACVTGDATAAIQGAIDRCFRAGGGVVRLSRGEWRTGGLRLRSRVTLYLESGAKLVGVRDVSRYSIIAEDAVEPVDPALIRDDAWTTSDSTMRDTIWRYPGNRWNNALIRLYRAKDAAIIGEPDSVIFGNNPYDEKGEELYRGPLGVNAIECENLVFKGYTITDTGNWAHRLCDVRGFVFDGVTCLGGHDAVHFNGCDDVRIENCTFKTGDDCVAGFDNRRVTVRNCYINSSCSAFRFAGRDVLIENCTVKGPGEWGFRGSLTKEQKIAGAPTPPGSSIGRKNMLSFFTYYADGTHPIRDYAGRIVIRDCTVENADRFLHYNYNNETWQRGVPMTDITFERVAATGIRLPLSAHGFIGRDVKLRLELHDCRIAFCEEVPEFIKGAAVGKLVLDGVEVKGLKEDAPLFRGWGREMPDISRKDVTGVGEKVERGVGAYGVSGI